jgi:hypothetical protein
MVDLTNRKYFMVLPTYPDNLPFLQVTNIFHDLEESNVLRSYMSDAIEDISKACAALEMKEAAPPVAGINYLNLKVIVIC